MNQLDQSTTNRVVSANLRTQTEGAESGLEPREKVIKMRYGLGSSGEEHTLEIGQQFNVTRERSHSK